MTRIASLPQVFEKIEEALENPHSSVSDIARIVEEDTALTTRVLRLVNSPFFGFVSKVETVQAAVKVMGTQQLRELALSCSVVRVFSGIPADVIDMEGFWRHSIACGVAARAIALLRGEPGPERLLVAGLLHDIGRLVLLMERPYTMKQVLAEARAESRLLYHVEREHLGFDHACLGALLMRNWRLSARLVDAVAFHHAPSESRGHPVDAATLNVADIVVNALAFGSSGERFVPPLDAAAWDRLGIPLDRFDAVLEALQTQYDDAVHFIFGD